MFLLKLRVWEYWLDRDLVLWIIFATTYIICIQNLNSMNPIVLSILRKNNLIWCSSTFLKSLSDRAPLRDTEDPNTVWFKPPELQKTKIYDNLLRIVMPWAANRRLFNRKFKIVRIGKFWRIQRGLTQNICEIVWVCKKTIWNENSGPQTT